MIAAAVRFSVAYLVGATVTYAVGLATYLWNRHR